MTSACADNQQVAREIHAIVPVKELARAKSRLAEVLSPAARRRLMLMMLGRLLHLLTGECGTKLAAVWVVSNDAEVLPLAAEYGVRTLPDSAGELNGALEGAREAVQKAGGTALLVVPADLPQITAADIAELSGALQTGAAVVLAPDAERDGTNALGLRLPSPLRFQFGIDSFARHYAAAVAHSQAIQVYASPTLALDIDTPENLQKLVGWESAA